MIIRMLFLAVCFLASFFTTGCKKGNIIPDENSYTRHFRINANNDTIFTFYIPNAFSPNGDGKNERFLPKGTGIQTNNYEMKIYDRSKLIFETNHPGFAWVGHAGGGGNTVQHGLYTYKIKLEDITGEAHSFTGSVQLIK